jgi:hypothetical protein
MIAKRAGLWFWLLSTTTECPNHGNMACVVGAFPYQHREYHATDCVVAAKGVSVVMIW